MVSYLGGGWLVGFDSVEVWNGKGGRDIHTRFTGAAVADTDELCDVVPWW